MKAVTARQLQGVYCLMHELNLMPLWARQKQQKRRLWKWLGVVEAVIFLLAVLSTGFTYRAVGTAQSRLAWLDAQLRNEQYTEADQIAGALKDAEAEWAKRQARQATLPETLFGYAWLDAVNQSIPEGVSLMEIDRRDRRVTITATAAQVRQMEQHRAALAETDCFAWVRIGAASRIEDGRMQYTLSLEVR